MAYRCPLTRAKTSPPANARPVGLSRLWLILRTNMPDCPKSPGHLRDYVCVIAITTSENFDIIEPEKLSGDHNFLLRVSWSA